MIRPSQLSIAEDCGYSSTLAERYPQGSTAASAGDAFHKRAAPVVDGTATDPEISPMVATFPSHVKSEAEVKVALSDPETGQSITEGTADVVLTHDDGSITIVDWKTGNPEYVDPPDINLQLLTYGLAFALLRGAPKFRVGLYFTKAPPLRLSKWFNDGEDYWTTLARIQKAAAADRSQPITGPHCNKCFQRKHCSAWLLPAFEGENSTALIPFTENGGGLTATNAATALRAVLAMKDIVEIAEARLKDFSREQGGIEDGGKVWSPVVANGRRTISVEAAEAAGIMPQLEAVGVVREGRPYERFSWRNAKVRKAAVKAMASDGGTMELAPKERAKRAAKAVAK